MKFLKILCAIGFFVVLISNIWSISGWIETRGVYDDICYLRQAHLFERFGVRGIDTNVVSDDDHYFVGGLKAIGFAEWNDVKRFPCHTWIPDADKYVLQYPPGTGFILSLFPAEFQVIYPALRINIGRRCRLFTDRADLCVDALPADAGCRIRR
jgi:hypothetical protein